MANEPIVIEQWENYPKQTMRNRAYIDSPNGPLALSVPIDKANFVRGKCLTRDVRIAYHEDWQHKHWNAIASSYYNSPFFEYLQDDFRPIYNKRWEYLMDLNEALIAKCCEVIDIAPKIERSSPSLTLKPLPSPPQGGRELKNSRIPELPSSRALEYPNSRTSELTPPYYQVFTPHKHPFLPNLSIIDLIFNLGPEALIYLTRLQSPSLTHSRAKLAYP